MHAGFYNPPVNFVFNTNGLRSSVSQLRTLVQESLAARAAAATLSAGLSRAVTTDVRWMRQPGAMGAPDELWFWEVTIPAPDLTGYALDLLSRSASSTQQAAERYGAAHFAEIQAHTTWLGAAALEKLRALHDRDADDLFYLGAQL